jgi:hypothetical protein
VIAMPERLFFAVKEVDAYGSKVKMVEAEKAVLDCIEHPEAAGDIPEIAGKHNPTIDSYHAFPGQNQPGRIKTGGLRFEIRVPIPDPAAGVLAGFPQG